LIRRSEVFFSTSRLAKKHKRMMEERAFGGLAPAVTSFQAQIDRKSAQILKEAGPRND
jgi:hypothetical protein